MKEFVHLHNHSDYSLLRATSTTSGLVAAAVEMGMPAIALTDDGNLFGACEFYLKSMEAGIKPIIGCDFFLAPEGRHSKSRIEDARQYQRLVLLAENNEGYQNLIKLSSLGYTEGFYYKPRIDRELLEKYHSGLIALSGGRGGEIPQLIARNQDAREAADFYAGLFGRDHFYLELSDHDTADQKLLNSTLINMAADQNLKLVASNDTYYLKADDAQAHDVLLCIGNKRKRGETDRFRFSSEQFYLKTPEEMWQLFGDHPDALKNSLAIAEQCSLKMDFPGPLLPDYDIPPDFPGPDAYLRHITEQGFQRRYANPPTEWQQRLDYELDTIISMGYTGYFLIVWDFIHYAREKDIPVGPGRGSGTGSIVAYSLGITDIDPMKYNLLFERFLNPERVSMPDFDIDFCFERRQELIDYVTRKYGNERVGQIITFGTLKPRAVIRDVARVLDFTYDEADHVAKLIPEGLKTTISSALKDEPQLKELYDGNDRYRELIDIGKKLQNLHRHASTHAAGIVIGKEELTRYVPLFRDARTGAISTQFTMEQLEDNGLVKMDILGLKTLTLIQHTVELIAETAAETGTAAAAATDFDIETIPMDDPKTFEMLGQGRSLAVFQFESAGMRKILARAKPSCIEDLIALNSLFRPGPMENIEQFIDSKQGRMDISYPHPDLEAVLRETYGVIVYQEQVLETVRIIAGFSRGKADILRRAMGKKKVSEMARMREEYMAGAAKNGIDEPKAAEIFDILQPFAGYGFNKGHATAYSVLAYKTAYLKAHYPAQFMAANLANEIDNSDNFILYLNEVQEMGMTVRPPDINRSEKHFTVLIEPEGENIIFGLRGIKGVGAAVGDEILRARETPYTSMEDFLERIDLKTVNRRALEVMLQCGVFDSLHPSRKAILENLDTLMNIAVSRRDGKQFGQTSLFEASPDEEYPSIELNTEDRYPLLTRLKWEKELIGRYFSGHPLDEYKLQWASGTDLDLEKIPTMKSDSQCQLVGLLSQYREITTKKGGRMASGMLEDFRGSIGFVIFPDVFKNIDGLETDRVVVMRGKLDFRDGRPQLVVLTVRSTDQVQQSDNGEIHIRPGAVSEDCLIKIRQLIHGTPGPCPIFIHLSSGENEKIVRGSTALQASLSVMNELRGQSLVEDVWQELYSVRI